MKIKYFICFLIIIPIFAYTQDDLKDLEIFPEDIQEAIYKREKTFETELPPEIEKLVSQSLILEKTDIWNEGVLKVSFKGGDVTLHRKIAETANIWTNYGDITFDFGYNPIKNTFRQWKQNDSSHIRVGFDLVGTGNWSLIGSISVDWTLIPRGFVSLHLEGFDNGRLPSDWKTTVLHEFGHALGFRHEHQRSDIECDFNWPRIYTVLWNQKRKDKKWVDRNFRKFNKREYKTTKYDKKSIMHYSLPRWMFKSKENPECFIEKNVQLSALDKKMMNDTYPSNRSDFLSSRKSIAVTYEEIAIAYEKADSAVVASNTVSYEIFSKKADYFSKERIENSKYIVGIQGLNVDKKEYSIFAQYVKNRGYTINLNSNYKENKPWLANVSIVLYYSKKNKEKAKGIALELSKVTGQKFVTGIGNGLAVFDPDKQFYVHWIPKPQ
ncbi:hypothetical protein H7U19_10570 [Hyunsoonleella sp. SJ7]|uniref:Peptidase metallopeptidase domain-containing protein n=1 Tax=Hyunsoonleella aquatilis TaxID=2762758 RepID=A0A923HCF4_9FLAO|nr:M12 family metallopeptidase [Hyunsoonleella aquatilis]MBC3758849.1 hypothetical protein [Hyunsoonleella aquatilis]